MSGHHHGHSHAAVGENTDSKRLSIALALIVAFMVAEVTVGVLVHSLALLSDAAHMLTDAGALVLSLVTIRLIARPAKGNLTFGLKRTEILSAQANGYTLLFLAGLIVFEGVRRLISPPKPGGLAILIVALVGIGVNLLATWQLSKANRESMNIRGSFQHILTDLLAFVFTAIAGAVILATGFVRADGIASLDHRRDHAVGGFRAASRLGPGSARGRARGHERRRDREVSRRASAGAERPRSPRLADRVGLSRALGACARRAR